MFIKEAKFGLETVRNDTDKIEKWFTGAISPLKLCLVISQ